MTSEEQQLFAQELQKMREGIHEWGNTHWYVTRPPSAFDEEIAALKKENARLREELDSYGA